MEDIPLGQISVNVAQHVAQGFKCDIEIVPNPLRKAKEEIVLDLENPKKQRHAII